MKGIENKQQAIVSSDLISRQAAIDAVHKNYDSILDFKSDGHTVADSFEDIINALPSAQPERSEQPESAKKYCEECDHIEMCRWYPFEGCEFRSFPSAEPQRKKGKWIEGRDERFVKCSECGMESTKNALMGIALFGEKEPHFCPNCGSYNGGKEDEID